MRLGQLARKHNIPVQDIISYLEETTNEQFHPNTKIYDTLIGNVFDHFDLGAGDEYDTIDVEQTRSPIEEVRQKSDQTNDTQKNDFPRQNEDQFLSPEDEIAAVEGEISIHTLDEDSSLHDSVEPEEVIEEKEVLPAPDEIIQTDALLDLLESEHSIEEINKIKLIKASKRELTGLKVLGKVDLPELQKKVKQKKASSPTQPEPVSKQRSSLSEEEREKRRLRAKRKKEAYETRKEKREKAAEVERLKALKAKHYQQKLGKVEPKKMKEPEPVRPVVEQKAPNKEEIVPKTLLGKWWRWMNI